MNFHGKRRDQKPLQVLPVDRVPAEQPAPEFSPESGEDPCRYVREGMAGMDSDALPGMFSIPLARMIGPSGKVIAIDVQQKMLVLVRKKSENRGLTSRITFYRIFPASLLTEQADLILSFWMVHEVPDQIRFFKEVRGHFRPGGKYLKVRPALEVREPAFRASVERARHLGFALPKSRR
jgi:2-polyprenyl-3-methyl-5-hydroxy-6-metoxy-1,4-benzoquinol methylase